MLGTYLITADEKCLIYHKTYTMLFLDIDAIHLLYNYLLIIKIGLFWLEISVSKLFAFLFGWILCLNIFLDIKVYHMVNFSKYNNMKPKTGPTAITGFLRIF